MLNEFPELSSIPQHLSEPNFVAAGYADKRLPKVRVPGATLWELLRRHRAPPVIEYMSLDIEGAEVGRAQGLSLRRVSHPLHDH